MGVLVEVVCGKKQSFPAEFELGADASVVLDYFDSFGIFQDITFVFFGEMELFFSGEEVGDDVFFVGLKGELGCALFPEEGG